MPLPIQTLENGLKVAFFPRPDYPFVSAQLWVRMGSCFEAADEAGMAHFIEHLAFRLGPQNEPPFAAQIDMAAGKMNAYTSHLNTVFFANVLKEDTPLALKSLLAILGPLEFNAEDVAKERQIILEEYAKVMASPYQRSYERLLNTLDKGSGHKHPLIGTQENITLVTPEKLATFRQKHYHASNALLLLSGGVENESELLKHLGQQTLNEGQGKDPFANDFQIADPLLVSKSDCNTSFIHHVWLTGPYDEAASACAHLNQLHLSRHFKQPLLAGVQFLPGLKRSALICSGILNETLCNEAHIEKIAQVLHQVRSYQLSHQQFRAAQKNYVLTKLKHAESITHVYDQGESFASWGDLQMHQKHLECIQALSYDNYYQANQKLQTQPGHWHIHAADTLKPHQEKLVSLLQTPPPRASQDTSPPQTNAAKASTASPKAADVNFPYYIRQRKDVDTFHCRISFRGGSYYETAQTQGHTFVLSKFLEKAAEARLEAYNVQPKAFSGVHSYGLDIYGDANDAPAALAATFQCLAQPDFESLPQKQIIANCKDTSGKILWYLKDEFVLKQKLFGDHPYALMSMGTPKTIEALQVADLLKRHQQSAHQNHLVTAYAGPHDEETMAALLKQEAGRLSANPTTLPTPSAVTPHFDGTKYVGGPAKERRKIRIAHEGLPYGHEDYLYLLFLLYVLKRKEGPIYQNIREQGGLTYMLDIHSFSSLDVGYFGVALECAAEKVDTVLSRLGESMHQVLQEIKDERNFQTWLNTFYKKQRFQNQSLQSHCTLACHNYWFGKGFEYDREYTTKGTYLDHAKFSEFSSKFLKSKSIIFIV